MHINDFYRNNKEKVFLIFNTACFGDVLLCNALCQNIKIKYPNSKVVFIVDKPYLEVAKYQKDVDDVIIYDKKGEHKGILGFLKFIFYFKYKFPYCTFVTYMNIRNYVIGLFLFSANIVSGCKHDTEVIMQKRHANLLTKITKQPVKNLPIVYEVSSDIPESLKSLLNKKSKYIALSPLTKKKSKDIPIQVTQEIMIKIKDLGYIPILCGVGKEIKEYSKTLLHIGCEFIDLTNKTSIPELASVLKNCLVLISADTGTMHLGYSLGIYTVAVFYDSVCAQIWGPQKELYRNTCVISEDQTPDNILKPIEDYINVVIK